MIAKKPKAVCEICGEPLPPGEEMFKYHGYSGPCPKPPLARQNLERVPDKDLTAYANGGWAPGDDVVASMAAELLQLRAWRKASLQAED